MKNKKSIPYCRKHLIEYIYGSIGKHHKIVKERPSIFSDAAECVECSKPGINVWVSENFQHLWNQNKL